MLKNAEIKKKIRHRFFVTPKHGINFSGVLIKRTNIDSVFADAKVHLPNADPEPVKGEVYIDNDNIAYMQLMPPEEKPTVVNNVTHLTQITAGDADD